MAITRIVLETIITNRVGALMSAVGFAVTYAGTNADLDDPLAWAARKVDATTANYNTVTDAELAAVAAADYDDLIELAVYRTLNNILGNLDDVDIAAGPRSEKLSQLATQVEKMIEKMQPLIDGMSRPIVGGYISLNFAEHNETVI